MPTASRASPLPPDARRAALIASTLRLVAANGGDVTTRQIAQAAGVGEGTIFRVFASKDDLVDAAAAQAMDPGPLVFAVGGLDPDLPLETRLTAVVTLVQDHLAVVFQMMNALGVARALQPPKDRAAEADRRQSVIRALATQFEGSAAHLRYSPTEAARRLWLLTFAFSHPKLVDGNRLPAADIVAMLLDGVRAHHTTTSPQGGSC